MRYSTEPKYRKYVKGHGFLSFARKFGDIFGKKLMDTTTNTGTDTAETASKQVVQKSAEATRDLIGNKTSDIVTSLGKTKSKEKENERQEIYIPREKRQILKIIILISYKNEITKDYKLVKHNI